jgi:hypothetical protein
MSATQSTGTSIAFRTLRPQEFHQTASRPIHEVYIPPVFTDKTNIDMLNRFGEQFQLTGIDISPEESRELRVFDKFLARHVQPNMICDVQCMLLWNEWIRTFQRRTPGFPKLIREKEFRDVITKNFNIKIATDGFRGAVYPGIKFIP